MKNTQTLPNTAPETIQKLPEPLAPDAILNAFEQQPPILDFVLPGFLKETVGALVSPGGAGKSWLALEIAIALASGHDIAGLWTRPDRSLPLVQGPTTYLAAEDPPEILQHRLHSLHNYLPKTKWKAVADSVTIVPLVGSMSDLQLISENGTSNQKAVDQLRRWSTGQRLVILDTIRRFHAANESASQPMSRLLNCLENCAKDTGAAVLYLHHISKFAAWNDRGDEATASRGSSVLTEHARWQAALVTKKIISDSGTKQTTLKYIVTKTNYGPPQGPRHLRRTDQGVLIASRGSMSSIQGSMNGSRRKLPIAKE